MATQSHAACADLGSYARTDAPSEQGGFPQIIITEILDNEFGLDVSGPVGRLMDAGAHAYLPPRPLEQVAQNVQSYLESRARPELGSPAPSIHQIGS